MWVGRNLHVSGVPEWDSVCSAGKGFSVSLTVSNPGASLFKVCLNCNLQGKRSITGRTALIFLTGEFLSATVLKPKGKTVSF